MSQPAKVGPISDSGGGGKKKNCGTRGETFPPGSNNECIDCDRCGESHHSACTNLTPSEIRTIGRLKLKGIRFFCTKCVDRMRDFMYSAERGEGELLSNDQITAMQKQLDSIQNSVAEINSEIQRNSTSKQYEDLMLEMDDLKHGVGNLSSNPNIINDQSYASVISKTLGDFKSENEMLNQQIKASVDKASKIMEDQSSQQDLERRKLNVVIHWLPETGQMNLSEKVLELSRSIHYDPTHIVKHYRLGKTDPDSSKAKQI